MARLAPAPPPASVAIVLLSAIGDVVRGMPVATSLRRAWPETRVHWFIQPAAHALVAPHPSVDEFHVFDRGLGPRAFADLRHSLSGRRFDVALGLQTYLKAGLLLALLPARRKVGFDRARARDAQWLFSSERIPVRPPGHVQDQYFEFLRHLGVPPVPEWEFAFSGAERAARRAYFERLGRPALAVVLRSTRPVKDWPLERYARVLEIAESDLGLRPVIVGSGSAAERAAAREVLGLTRARPRVELADDLRRLAWLLDGSAAALSPDTGPYHIAVALGTPAVGLFGATDPKRVGPWGRFEDLVVDGYGRPGDAAPSADLRPGGMDRIGVERVAEALERAARTPKAGPCVAAPSRL